jgi:hypothetical protein
MATQHEVSIRYNVIIVNLLFRDLDFFLKGTWDGKDRTSLENDKLNDTTFIKELKCTPIIIDNINHQDEIMIRDYANECRLLYVNTLFRSNIPTINVNMYSKEIASMIENTSLLEELSSAEMLTAIENDLSKRISKINEKTLRRKDPPKTVQISFDEVHNIYSRYSLYVDEINKDITALDPDNVTIRTLKEMVSKIKHIPDMMEQTKSGLQDKLKSIDPPTEINDEQETEESTEREDIVEKKPRARIDITREQQVIEFNEDYVNPSTVDQFPIMVQNQTAYASAQPSDTTEQREIDQNIIDEPTYTTDLGEEIPGYRPTMEPEAMRDLANKIKAAPFGKMKGVRKLETPIEIILSYATYLIAMIGEATVTNITTKSSNKGRSDWFHIKEQYRSEYIRGFYAAYGNYKNTVHPDTRYRKEYVNNGMIAAMTLLISTSIGASDEIFLKAVDHDNWKKNVYPFISGRRKLTSAEKDLGNIIVTGKFKPATGGTGVLPPSIIDFFDHAYPLKDIVKPTHTVRVAALSVNREDSDQDKEPYTKTFFDVTTDITKTKPSTEKVKTGTVTRILRERKSIESPSSPPPQYENRTFPVPLTKSTSSTPRSKRKQIVGPKGRSSSTKKKARLTREDSDDDSSESVEAEIVQEDDTVIATGIEMTPIGPKKPVDVTARQTTKARLSEQKIPRKKSLSDQDESRQVILTTVHPEKGKIYSIERTYATEGPMDIIDAITDRKTVVSGKEEKRKAIEQNPKEVDPSITYKDNEDTEDQDDDLDMPIEDVEDYGLRPRYGHEEDNQTNYLTAADAPRILTIKPTRNVGEKGQTMNTTAQPTTPRQKIVSMKSVQQHLNSATEQQDEEKTSSTGTDEVLKDHEEKNPEDTEKEE